MSLPKRSQQKVDNIKVSAKHLFNSFGYNHVTIDDIIQHSNVSRGTVYKYFSDKQNIYETIIRDIYNLERELVKDTINSNDDFLSKIKKIISIRVDKYKDTHKRFFEDHYIRSKELDTFMLDYTKNINLMRNNLYKEGREKGYLSEDISNDTMELYFDIFQTGLSQKYHTLSEMPKQELTNVLSLIYAGMVSCK